MALRTPRRRSPISAPTGVGLFAMRRLAHRTHLAGLLIFLAACRGEGGRAGASHGALTVTDDAGRTVALDAPARRIVSLSPAVTELLYALGAGDRVVGRTTWCDYPPEVSGVPSVGDGLNPNLEAVAALRPDLAVLYRSPLNEGAARRLDALGIRAVVLRQDRLEDLARAARLLGRLTGRLEAGDSLVSAITGLRAAPGAPLGVSLAVITWDNPLIVIGGTSYLDELTTLAGGRNVFHDIAAPSSVVSLETLAGRNPDVLAVLVDRGPAVLPAFASRREWQAVPAVRAHRFVVLAGSLFGRPSPRAGIAIAELRRRLMAAR